MEITLHRDGRVTLNGEQVASWEQGQDGIYRLFTDHPTRAALSQYLWQEFRRSTVDHIEREFAA